MSITTTERPGRIASEASSKSTDRRAKGEPGASKAKGLDGKKPKSKKVKIMVLVALLVVLAALAKFTVLAPSAPAKDAKPVPGPVLAMEDMTLNLAGGHYLRIRLALQTTKGTNAELDTSEAAQAVIEEFSDRSTAELSGDAARLKAKKELLGKLQKIYPKQILDVIYTEFFTQ
jgi:flagellar FliL protein